MRPSLRVLLRIFVLHLIVALQAAAQEAPREVPAAGSVEEAGPATFYLPDEKGNLVPVPGITYERFRDLLLLESRTGVEPPEFTIEKISLLGRIEGDTAEVDAEINIVVRKAGWVMVPLRMAAAPLREALPEESSDDVIHRFDAKEGHVVWLHGTANRRHAVRLPLVTSIKQLGGQEQLAISLPKSSESRLELNVPGIVSKAELKSGEGILQTSTQADQSKVVVIGAAGEIAATWRLGEKGADDTAAIDVVTEIAAYLETRDTVRSEAKIRLTQPSELISQVFVRLPPHMELSPRVTSGYSVAIASADDLKQAGLLPPDPSLGAVVRVIFERSAESTEFVLQANYKPEAGSTNPLELGGFEVLAASRQSGYLSVYLPTGWSLKTTLNSAAYRTDEIAAAAGQPRASARYRFVRQPFSLTIDAAPQPPRTVVEPDYLARVQADRVTLKAKIAYQVRGPRPEYVEIDLGNWKLDSAGPPSLVSVDAAEVPSSPLRLTLLPGMEAEFTAELQMHREIPAGASEVVLKLPRILATQMLPATLTVTSDDNVALSPQSDDMVALAQDDRSHVVMPNGGRSLVYRELPASDAPPQFVAEMQVRTRRVTVMLNAKAQIGPQRTAVEQKMSLDIAYEPLSTLVLEAPREVAISALQVFHGEQLLVASEQPVLNAPRGATALRRWQVELEEPVTGKLELRLQYFLATGERRKVELPLIAPAESEGIVVAKQKLSVQPGSEQQVVLSQRHAADPGLLSAGVAEGIELTWPRRIRLVELDLASAQATVGPALRVERQWTQIWLSAAARRDRFVARLLGSGSEFGVVLPAGVVVDDVRVLVDGLPPRALSVKDRLLSVGVVPSEQPRTLELWYLMPGRTASHRPERLALDLPRVAKAATPRQSLVQVTTPASELVLYSPSAVSAQQSWQKRGWLWQRAGARSTHELEAWAGATSEQPVAIETNDALFATMGPLTTLEVVVWGKRWLWMAVAGGVLAAGMVVHFLSRGRSLFLLGVLATAGCVAALLAPELALSVGQFLGVGLLLLVAVMWSLRSAGQPLAAIPAQPSFAPSRSDSRVARESSSATKALAPLGELRP